jgi:hypothetical protein
MIAKIWNYLRFIENKVIARILLHIRWKINKFIKRKENEKFTKICFNNGNYKNDVRCKK